MSKRFFIIVILLYLSVFSYAQGKNDSLYNIINTSETDTLRISVYFSLGDNFKDSLPDTSYTYYQKALKLAEKSDNKKYIIRALSLLASLKIYKEEYGKASEFYEKEIKICEELNDSSNLKTSVGNLGVLYFYLGNYPKALSHFLRLQKIAEALNDSSALTVAYTNIGIIFKKLGENEKALNYFNKNLLIAKQIGDTNSIATANNNIGLIYQDEKNDSVAVKKFMKAKELFQKTGDEAGEATASLNLGLSFSSLGKLSEAEKHYFNSLKIAEKINNNRLISEAKYELSEIYFKYSNSDKFNSSERKKYFLLAKKYADDSYLISKKYNYKNTVKKNTRVLIDIYKQTGNYKKALEFSTEHIAIKDSMFSKKNLEIIQQMNTKYDIYKHKTELEKKQNEIKQKNKLIHSQKLIIRYGIISGIFILFLSILIFIFYFRLKTQKDKVSELKKLQDYLINNLPAFIYLKDINLRYRLVNKAYAELFNLKTEDLYGKSDRELGFETKYESLDMQVLAMDKPIEPITEKFINHSGKEMRVSIKKVPFHNNEGKVSGIIGIVSDVTEYTNINLRLQKLLDNSRKQNKIIEKYNRDITDSLIYARTIQDAILPKDEQLKTFFSDYFIIYKGLQIVSGDFYYANKKNNILYFALADCTGHGVPGGFITMLSISFLNQIMSEGNNYTPSEILNLLRKKINEIFNHQDYSNKNGLDIALCSYDYNTKKMQYSGAYNSLFLLRNTELIEFKATRIPIGTYFTDKNFKNYEIDIQKDDVIYLFTDGIRDQIGGPNMKKFSSKRLKNLIIENSNLPFIKQKEIIEKTFFDWLGNNEQFDDISLFAVKL